MALAEQDIIAVEEIVKRTIQQSDRTLSFNSREDRVLYERVVRVEEELKHQKETIKAFMYQVDQRFEQMQHTMDRRFEQIDKRFEQMDKRFAFMQWMIGLGFTITIVAIAVARYLN